MEILRERSFSDKALPNAYEKYGFYTGYDFKIFGQKLGLRENLITKFMKTVRKKEPIIMDFINCSKMPVEMKSKAGSIISERMKALIC
jgi:serine/threonine-protein kinase HipA